jgi:hypothetical protein
MIAFIEGELFHYKRMTFAVYEMLHVDLIFTELWFYLLNGNSSTIREWAWSFPKSFIQFYWHAVVMAINEWRIFYHKRMNLTIS